MTEYRVVFQGAPIAKQRPRMTRSGRAYTPQRTKDAERRIAEQYEGPLFEGDVCIDICLTKDAVAVTIWDADYTPVGMRGDIDNYAKTILDALNGLAWNDDRQVAHLSVYKAEK